MNRWVMSLLRNFVGFILLFAALSKLTHFDTLFLAAYDVLGNGRTTLLLVSLLVASEFVIGFVLIANISCKAVYYVLVALFVIFFAYAIYLRVVDPTGILHPSCSCIGIDVLDDRRGFANAMVVRNALLLGVVSIVAWHELKRRGNEI
jgi:hypothetical protein